MDKGKLNNQSSWKAKLTSLQELQDESSYDFQASWHKLESRLQHTQKTALWSPYWIAAACLLIAICSTIPFAMNHHNASPDNSVARGTNSHLKQGRQAADKDFKDHQEQKKLMVVKKQSIRHMKKHLKKPLLEESIATESVAATPMSIMPDSLVAVVPQSILPEKKQRLRVVHINEIRTLMQEQRVVAEGSRESSRSIFPHNGTDDLIKIKILLSN